MSQVTNTPSLTPVGSDVSSITMTFIILPTSVSLAEALDQYYVVLPPPLITRDTMIGVVGLPIFVAVPATVPDTFSALCQLCHESFSGIFLGLSLPPILLCLLVPVTVFALYVLVLMWLPCLPMGA